MKKKNRPARSPMLSGRIKTLCNYALAVILTLQGGKADAEDDFRLANKGLSAEKILESATSFTLPRERPQVRYFANGPLPEKLGSVEQQRVSVLLHQRADQKVRDAVVSFGFPFPQAALYNLERLRVLDEKSQELQADISGLALWPDGSIKSALIRFYSAFATSTPQRIEVEFGNKVTRLLPSSSDLKVEETEASCAIDTGKIKVVVGKEKFIPFQKVFSSQTGAVIAGGSGIELRDENDDLYSTALGSPEHFTVERRSSQELVLRIEGKFVDKQNAHFMRYITRLGFRAGSSRVEMIHTHVNDELRHEFSDFNSLSLALDFNKAKEPDATTIGNRLSAPELALKQMDENTCEYLTDSTQGTLKQRSPGVMAVDTETGPVYVGIAQFWQRWPKGLVAQKDKISLYLLPKQSPEFGKSLPNYLKYPFVEGRYRMKWGMAFTERLSFDFLPQDKLDAFAAEMDSPIVTVINSDYVASTGVYGALETPKWAGVQFWDDYATRSLKLHHEQRDRQREYGFLNWGDWYGERGRNWGNNEYDRAHGFFSHFARTGEIGFFEDALSAARHQADCDIVHAYPDPFYVGANLQHSIGHSGISYQNVIPEWSYKYDVATSAGNGHTWSDGMVDCWLLTGDPVVMESLLSLGEHIAWAYAPSLKGLSYAGAHERNAGWSLMAILGAYRATGDQAYLDAAGKITSVVLREWDPRSGVWPHELPQQHADGRHKIRGNNGFNIGILLMGLARYHAQTGDPMVLKCITRACDWLVKAWDPDFLAWPYSADVEGIAVASPAPNVNSLIYSALAYAGVTTNNETYMNIAIKAFAGSFLPGAADRLAKEFSMKACTATHTLSLLAKAEKLNITKDWPSIYDILATLPSGRQVTFIPVNGASFRITKGSENARLTVKCTEDAPVFSVEIELTTAQGESVPPSISDNALYQWELPGHQTESFTFKIKHPYRWRISGEGFTADYLPDLPLRLRGYGLVSGEWIAKPGESVSMRLVGDGVGAMLVKPSGEFVSDRPESEGDARVLSYEAQEVPAHFALWANSSFTVALPPGSAVSLRLVDTTLLKRNDQ